MPPRKSANSSISQSLRASSVKSASAGSAASNFFTKGGKASAAKAQGKDGSRKTQSQQAAPQQQEKKPLARSASHSSLSSSSSTSSPARSISPEKRTPSTSAAPRSRSDGTRTASGGSATGAPLSTLSREEAAAAERLPDLDVEDRTWNGIWRVTQEEKLGKVGPIHANNDNRIHHVLRAFDLDPSYGPCLGLTRLERWHRAKKLGEEPPNEVYEILTTKQGVLLDEYRENCLAGAGV